MFKHIHLVQYMVEIMSCFPLYMLVSPTSDVNIFYLWDWKTTSDFTMISVFNSSHIKLMCNSYIHPHLIPSTCTVPKLFYPTILWCIINQTWMYQTIHLTGDSLIFFITLTSTCSCIYKFNNFFRTTKIVWSHIMVSPCRRCWCPSTLVIYENLNKTYPIFFF